MKKGDWFPSRLFCELNQSIGMQLGWFGSTEEPTQKSAQSARTT